jgi:hypothetical protein
MDLEATFNYRGYHHKYEEDDILCLKDSSELEDINQILLGIYESFDNITGTTWYLSIEQQELLKDKKLEVISCISWHLGIPFYVLKDLENDRFYVRAAEFYLRKCESVPNSVDIMKIQ